jgi:Zn-dependent peptidase ImmA (M78 family)
MKSSDAPPTSNERHRPVRARLTQWQLGIERHAMRLRQELGISDDLCLSHESALNLIPRCEVWALKHIPNLPFEHVIHFRNMARQFGAFAFKDQDGDFRIVFNDSYPPEAVRVYLMEEYFHIRLGHPFDTVRLYAEKERGHRTHSDAKEREAYGCSVAALVPYCGLELMLANGDHVARIAEHYYVPRSVVEYRVSATGLSDLIDSPMRQLSLIGNP